jgi:hypothetical protein
VLEVDLVLLLANSAVDLAGAGRAATSVAAGWCTGPP